MSTLPSKLNGVRHVIKHELKLNMRVVYTKVTEKSLTMSGSTGEVHWRMCQLVSLVVTQTGYGNLHAISHLLPWVLK